MSLISEKNKKSGVKILSNLVIAFNLTFFFSLPSYASGRQANESVEEYCARLFPTNERGAESCVNRESSKENNANQVKKDKKAECKQAEDAVKKASSELNKKCGEASLKQECQEEAKSCSQASGKDAYNSIGRFAEAAGFSQYSQALDTAFSGDEKTENKVCAKYSSKDYATEKKDVTKDLEKVAEDLADLTRKKAKLQKDFATEMKDIQKKVDDSQEELEKQKLKIKDNKRERIASFQNQQNQQKEQLRQKNMSILKVKGDIITADRDKAMTLAALTDAAGKRACLGEYNKARANYNTKTGSSSTSNFVASSSAKKNDLIAIYTDCMAIFQQKRVALNESAKQKMDTLNSQLANLQSEVDDLTGVMELASNQLAEMEQDAAKEQSQAEQKVIKLMQTAQQEMLTAQQDLNSNLQALAQEESNLKSKQNRLNNTLMTMGPEPKSGAKSTPESIASEAGALADDLSEAEEKLAALYADKESECYDKSGKSSRALREKASNRRSGVR